MVPPVGGRLVAFDSCVEHEVLPAHTCRCCPTLLYQRYCPRSTLATPASAWCWRAHSAARLPQASWGTGERQPAPLCCCASVSQTRWSQRAAPRCLRDAPVSAWRLAL